MWSNFIEKPKKVELDSKEIPVSEQEKVGCWTYDKELKDVGVLIKDTNNKRVIELIY